MKKLVGHLKFTNMAWSPDNLVKCINKYSNKYEAILINPNNEPSYSNIPITHDLKILNKIDILHLHNRYLNGCLEEYKGKKLIQYHSPAVDAHIDFNFPGLKLVIAQYPATIQKYKDMKYSLIRNSIDLDNSIYKEKKRITDKIRIGFSPSTKYKKYSRDYHSKGNEETEDVLKNIQNKYPNIEYDIIHKVNIIECLERKAKCNIIIDECVTSSYHRSGLEGLALGKLTICSLSEEIINLIKQTSSSDLIPFNNVNIKYLEQHLEMLINKGISYINEIGIRNYKWMKTYWNPRSIVKDLENYYDKL